MHHLVETDVDMVDKE